MMRAALALAERGLAVFPCRPRSKRPATDHGFKDASKDPNIIERWWRDQPNYNIAVATGMVSGVFMVDTDGLDGEAALRELELKHGKLPATVDAISARGRHSYFQYPGRYVKSTASVIAPHIDIRGDGGYAMVPPSVHPSGRRYCWSVDSHNAFAPAPKWLLDLVAVSSPSAAAPVPAREWRELVKAGVVEGARDSTVTKLTGHLLRREVDPLVVLELMQAWNATRCSPPLPTTDITRIVNSIAGKELQRRGEA